MAKFKFNIESDILNRSETRRYLLKLKADLELKFDGHVIIDEDKKYFISSFLIRGFNFPDTIDFKNHIEKTIYKIKN